MTDFPQTFSARPVWLMTLTDLALLLVGFLVLVQATAAPKREAIGRSLREAFGPETPAPMPVAALAVRFAPGAVAPGDPAALRTWTREAARDPRVAITVTAAADGSAADRGYAGGPTLLAADRARAVAAALAGVVPPERLRLATDPNPRGRIATVTLAFAGERP